MSRRRARLPFSLLGLLAMGLACSSSSTNPGGGGTGSGGAGGCGTGADLCKQDPTGCCSCASQQCAVENAACWCNADCVDIQICAYKCPDTKCIDACSASEPKGSADFEALRACAKAECAGLCVL